MRGVGFLLGFALAGTASAQMFSDDERAGLVAYWSEPGRYEVSAPESARTKGPWQVRLSIPGSQWLWNYGRALGLSKGPPTEDPVPANPEQKAWDAWIDAKLAWDRAVAADQAATANAFLLGLEAPRATAPKPPGPAPKALVALAGNPPPFACVVAPLQHRVTFDEKMAITYTDNPLMRSRYAYYRFPQGVMSAGTRVRELPADYVDRLFVEAGVSGSERKVMAAVSLLEGGFDSVNTYDTGFVSVGFIQFACLQAGAGSLGQVLRREKQENPAAFQADFRQFGIDVAETAELVAVDPATGAELAGADAAMKIIEDKRLIAVFQRAGKLSQAFRAAQIKVAKAMYYPGNDEVAIQVGGQTLSGPISTIVKSEAGMATLMDRKVNTGTLNPLPLVLALIAGENRVQKFEDLAKYERDIVAAMKFRKDYLADTTLTQPGPALKPKRDYGAAARHLAGRKGRGGNASSPAR